MAHISLSILSSRQLPKYVFIWSITGQAAPHPNELHPKAKHYIEQWDTHPTGNCQILFVLRRCTRHGKKTANKKQLRRTRLNRRFSIKITHRSVRTKNHMLRVQYVRPILHVPFLRVCDPWFLWNEKKQLWRGLAVLVITEIHPESRPKYSLLSPRQAYRRTTIHNKDILSFMTPIHIHTHIHNNFWGFGARGSITVFYGLAELLKNSKKRQKTENYLQNEPVLHKTK